jgi:hypothetical protein
MDYCPVPSPISIITTGRKTIVFTKREMQMRNKRVFTKLRYLSNSTPAHGTLYVDLRVRKGTGRRYWVHLKSRFDRITAIVKTDPESNCTEWYFGGENSLFSNSVMSGFWYAKEDGHGRFNCALNTRCYGKSTVMDKNFRKIGVVKGVYTARRYLM